MTRREVEGGFKFTVEAGFAWPSPRGARTGPCVSLEAGVLLDPVPQAREAAVHSGLVPLRAAIAPAHDSSQEHAAAGLHADQRPS